VADLPALLAERGARADRQLHLRGEHGVDDDVGGAGVDQREGLLAGQLDLDERRAARVAGQRDLGLAAVAGHLHLERLADERAVAVGQRGVLRAELVEGPGDGGEVALWL
jgi:hypothetical protein